MPTRSFSKALTRTRGKILILLVLAIPMPAIAQDIALPPAGGQYDSQLGGAYPPPEGTVSVSRDREDPPATDLYNICYVNAFQTQPQDGEWWIATHPQLLLERDGQPFEDPNWPGEYLLDIGTPEKREALLAIIGPWIDGCAADGFDAIEADNLDTYSRSDGLLSMHDTLAFAQMLTQRAHGLGLAFGQKNSLELGTRGRDIGFDFAITETCQVYDECGAYRDVFGDHILAIEYTDTDAAYFSDACVEHGAHISVIRRDRNLSTPASSDYFYQTC